jgi:pimeloyl-ACP methyl ester carboxylesterase
MQPVEWIDDALSEFAEVVPGEVGSVGDGFWQIYASMTLADMDGTNVRPNAPSVIAAIVNTAADRVFVVGHSLGAALSAYMAADLDKVVASSNTRLAPYFFAQPRTGTQAFVDNYRGTIRRYALANYISDIVPNLPSSPPFEALGVGSVLQSIYVIPRNLPGMPPFSLVNNHSPVAYARMLDPTNAVAQRLPL